MFEAAIALNRFGLGARRFSNGSYCCQRRSVGRLCVRTHGGEPSLDLLLYLCVIQKRDEYNPSE